VAGLLILLPRKNAKNTEIFLLRSLRSFAANPQAAAVLVLVY
jgi:hypothetical protein